MRQFFSTAFGVSLAALLVVSGYAQRQTDTARGFSAAALTAAPTTGWPTNGGNLYNQRYSPLAAITRANVGQLRGVWRTRLRGSGTGPQYSGFAQPLVSDGVAYVSTGANDVFALSLDGGEILWQYSANLDPNITSVCCGWNNKGVALSEDKVFIGQLDGKLLALDRRTGRVVWSIQAERWQENFSITAAPLYVNNMVIIGFAGGDRGTRSRLKAYDAADGRLIWTFYTIPGPGEPGHDTWPKDNDAWKYGGAAIWQTPAFDPELGLLYFSTGNAAPDYNGAFRAGDNLYAASMLAIEAATGKYRWHFQQVHHDIWDYDAVNPVVLMNVTIGGRTRKAIVEVGKTGWAYILDRETGKPLIGIDEKPVPQEPRQATAKTQPFPRGDAIVPQFIQIAPEGSALVNDGRIFTPFVGTDPTIVAPGIWGGASWPPSSYDPVQQRLFVCASSVINGYTGGGDPAFAAPKDGVAYLGGATTFTRVARTGIVAALDVTTNKIAWRYQWPEQCYSGTLATAGGLLFVGRSDGRLTALDSANGKQLWEFQTGAGMHAPASTFEHRGRQYVLAFSAGAALLGSARGDSVWLFGLDGTIPPAEPGRPVSRQTAAPAPPQGATATAAPGGTPRAPVANVAAGQRLYEQACVVCHGADGRGGHGAGPSLVALTDLQAMMRTVTAGRNDMPPFGPTFTPEQIRDVSTYVLDVLAGRASRGQVPAPATADASRGAIVGTGTFTAFVENMDRSLQFYKDVFGMEIPPMPDTGGQPYNRTNPQLFAMFDIPGARERHQSARVPGTRLSFEVMEVQDVAHQTIPLRIQDPGTATLVLVVRNLDATLARVRQANVPVVTSGGTPVLQADGTRAVLIRDVDGRFIELRQPAAVPDAATPGASDIIDLRISVTVGDMDRTKQVYRDVLGFTVEGETAFAADRAAQTLTGLPTAEVRRSRVQASGSTLWIEFVEFKGVPRTPLRMRIQDRGAARLQLRAQNLDAMVATMKNAGLTIVSQGGGAVPIPPNLKGALVADPNNFFLTPFAPCDGCTSGTPPPN